MKLSYPVIITSRLLPGVLIGSTQVSIEYGMIQSDGRQCYNVYLDGPECSHIENGVRSGCQGGALQEGLASFLGFLSAAVESYQYGQCTGLQGENARLFPLNVVLWVCQYSDEISLLSFDLEAGEKLIEE